ncbi:hypothetical protein [Sphingorhabdus sp. Alg239-R122]|uniref:hypothetical protein n=1 Tax=Sphingorhabdus sp. Alg239-R122 TaxID=2305989 RepID=UPI0013DD6CFC|nr:hypothetical protein [Sphingorhabdus sp. Alg239-R122]
MLPFPREIISFPILAGVSLLATACSANPAAQASDKTEVASSNESSVLQLKFRKGQVLSFVAPEAREDGDAAREAYYSKAFPIAEKLGFSRKAVLRVQDKIISDYDPSGFILYSWPDAGALAAFEADSAWPAIKASRPDAWSELKIYTDELEEDLTLSFDPAKTYTVVVAWLNPGKEADYARYLDGITEAVNAAGGRFIYKMKDPVFESHASSPAAPQQLTFVEWDNVEGFSKVRQSDAYKQNQQYFASGVDHVEFYRLALPEEK